MTKITCDIEAFKQYIHDSSASIFSEESNKAHDWLRKITCYVGKNEHVLKIHPAECYESDGKFYFLLELELLKDATKTEAKELLCHVADEMQFHPNIRVLDRTEHSEAIGWHATKEEPTGDDRYFWLHPKGFKFQKDEFGRYCWGEVPECPSAYPWEATMLVEVKTTPVAPDGWGRSFDLNPDIYPVGLLRTAIRERDEEVAKKKEADRLAAERAEREHEKLKGCLEIIGDFVILDAGVLTPIKELWINSDGGILLLGNRGRDPFQLSIVDGFDENVQKIIKWAVDNGAMEPEPKADAA